MQQPGPQQPPEEPPTEAEERVTPESMQMSFWPLWVMPFAAVGASLVVALYFPDDVQDFFFDTVFPFGVTFWMGTFIAYMWDMQKLWIQEIPRKYAAWAVGGCLVALLFMMGGPQALIDDPWLAGMIAFPGVRLLMSYQKRHRAPPRHV
jgi:hypothetical protein